MQAQSPVAASSAQPLITQQVDNSVRTTLHGNVSPLVKTASDQGAADTSLQAPRIQLMLKRPADREAALRQYITDIHNKNSASYHKWLTPEQIAQKYGPADSDVQTVVAWLQTQGFTVNKVSRAKSVIEFGGSVGQVQTAFNTQIHKYAVNGETHFANATDPQIPSALSAVVNGVVRLNDFRPRPQLKVMGTASYSAKTHKAKANWNYPLGGNEELFLVAPGDFAVQYDTAPLTSAGTTGTGVTIGIINDSNVDLTLVNAFRTLFSLPANTPKVIVDGTDPGINGDSSEAYLDVEWSGAVAPAATINLYTAADTTLAAGLDLAAARAVDDDVAQVLSLSFGACEYVNTSSGNAYYESLWEQAAAQGQTVMASSGDSGSESCDPDSIDGLAVSAQASTPFNVAVGGTDFYYSDYASTPANSIPASFTNYWSNPSATTTTPATTITTPIPEQPWDDSQYGLNIAAYASGDLTTFYADQSPVGGGGGASSCANQTDNSDGSVTCLSGYAKPAYQSALTPADGVRDLPDVSLFAANGLNYSLTPICASPGDCNTDGQSAPSGDGVTVTSVGGTSVAAPSFAGIMALVDQKYGQQGAANYVLYPLFQQYPAAFHDVTTGSNNEPCNDGETDLTTCVVVGGTVSAGDYSAATGYDLASGLGSVDANVLVTDWNKVTFTTTSTTLALSSPSITHGATETLTATVTGATSGDVSFLTSVPVLNNKGANSYNASTTNSNFATVGSNGVATLATTTLPGGTYTITAQYAGNGTAGISQSAAQTITVTPEASNINLVGTQLQYAPDSTTGQNDDSTGYIVDGTSYPYGTYITADAQPVGTSVSQPSGAAPGSGTLLTDGIATGTVKFTDTSAGSATIALNSQGFAEWSTGTFGVGSHSISASYSGDSSFNASTSATPVTFTITKGTAFIDVLPGLPSTASGAQAGTTLSFQIVLYYLGSGAAPTGSVTVGVGSQTQTATLQPFYAEGNYSAATVTFANVAASTSITVAYSGDSNWSAIAATPYSFTVGSGTALASTTTLAATPTTNVNNATTVTLTATVAGTGAAPTGTVTFYSNAIQISNPITLASVGGTMTATLPLIGFDVYGGANQFLAVYSGDTNYAPSSGNATIAVDQSDFTLAAQNQVVSIGASASGAATVNLGSLNGFDNTVNLTCASPSSNITCSISPASVTVNLNGPVTATVTINVGSGTTASNDSKPFWFAGGATAIACVLLFGVPARRRSWRTLLGLLLFGVLMAGNGCGGGSSTPTPTEGQTATPTFSVAGGTYSSTQAVTIADTTAGATIYYTTDGTTPTTSSTKYTAAISVNSTETLSAIAAASGDTNSAVAIAAYTISTPIVTQTGTNSTIHNVTIEVVTPTGTSTVVVKGTVAGS
jgi:hypothetical protein